MSDPTFVQETLPNGLRVVIEVMPHVSSAACGFLVRTGARDEPAELAGVSHFLEHMCFKGTPTRTWERINIEFDEMGADYNAFTSRDRTFYYGWVRCEDLERQMALLADMMRSTLPPSEFDMEKNVILEEIAMSKDDLTSTAYDCLYERMLAGSPLAWPVLGYDRTVQALSRDQMHGYFSRRYAPNNLTLIVSGRVEPARVLDAARRLCGAWEPAANLRIDRPTPALRPGIVVQQLDRFHQQVLIVGFPSASALHPHDETAEAVAAILGGTNSRFYWNIIQEGIATRAGVFREEYADFGLIAMFGLCEPENCEQALEVMRREAERLVREGPEPKELLRVKNLRRTSLANESEAPYYRLGQLVDDMSYQGDPQPAEKRMAAVDAVTADTIAAYLQEFPITGEGFLVSVGPRQWPA